MKQIKMKQQVIAKYFVPRCWIKLKSIYISRQRAYTPFFDTYLCIIIVLDIIYQLIRGAEDNYITSVGIYTTFNDNKRNEFDREIIIDKRVHTWQCERCRIKLNALNKTTSMSGLYHTHTHIWKSDFTYQCTHHISLINVAGARDI